MIIVHGFFQRNGGKAELQSYETPNPRRTYSTVTLLARLRG